MSTAGQTYVEGDCRRCGDQLQTRETWSRAEVRTFLAMPNSDRLCVAWRLSPHGLRRGEALSLRWSDIDFQARVLTVDQVRVLVGYPIRIEEPEYRNGIADAATPRRSLVCGTAHGTAGREIPVQSGRSALDSEGKYVTIQGPSPDLSPAVSRVSV